MTPLARVLLRLAAVSLLWHSPSPDRVTEDDPRWDCHTMGNRICASDIQWMTDYEQMEWFTR